VADNKNVGNDWLLKILAIAVPPVILEHILPRCPHLAFALGILGGVLLQHFIPPSGSARQLSLLFAAATALAFLNWYLF
jgi:hypothetical protein